MLELNSLHNILISMGDTAVHTDKGTRHGHVRQSVTITSSTGLKLRIALALYRSQMVCMCLTEPVFTYHFEYN